MDYKELQKRAKELGLKSVGVSAEDLKKNIAEAEAEESPQEEPQDNENRDAVVYNGKHEVRTYTREQHGEDYVDLAKQYVSHPDRDGYTIKFEEVTTRISCPHCGMKFRHP